jgi:hypothetical protein
MRAFGIALVTASILLSSGGVVYRRSAQAEPSAGAPEASGQDEVCRVQPTPDGVAPQLRRARIAAPQGSKAVISLGSSGFNYSRPGDPLPTPVRVVAPDPAPASAAD